MTQLPPPKHVSKWKTLASEMALDEKWFPVRKDRIELPQGKVIDDYFVWESPRIAMVVPVTPEGKFVLVRQYRHALGEIFCQFPAGALDKGELAEAAAIRELQEETGYRCQKLVFLGSLSPYATKMTGVVDVYLAQNATFDHPPEYDEQEESETILLTPEELVALPDTQEVFASDLLACIFLAFRHLDLPLT